MLELLALTLAVIHFGFPLAYYFYAKKKWLPKPWNLEINPNYKPKVAVVVPTFNEAKFIEKKLDEICKQEYPKDKLEIIVVDSASTDGTPELVQGWSEKRKDIKLKLLQEPARRGKAQALNHALKYISSDVEVVTITDVDCSWPSMDVLAKTMIWFSDSRVGAVSCLKYPASEGMGDVEVTYRNFYNQLRIAESKAWSTPIFHGELAAFRRSLLDELNGFPTDIGADDSHEATRIALMGYRAIIPQDLWVKEVVPKQGYFQWRVRRAQHLVQHFVKLLKAKPRTHGEFKKILRVEQFLHLINPWFLLGGTLLLLFDALAYGSIPAIAFLFLGLMLFSVKPYRTWIVQQIFLLIGAMKNVWSKEVVWSKQVKP